MPEVKVRKGTTPLVKFELLEEDGSVFSLTGNVATFKVVDGDNNDIWEKTLTITDAAAGECQVSLTTTDTASALSDGLGQVRAVNASAVTTYISEPIDVIVEESIF